MEKKYKAPLPRACKQSDNRMVCQESRHIGMIKDTILRIQRQNKTNYTFIHRLHKKCAIPHKKSYFEALTNCIAGFGISKLKGKKIKNSTF